MSNFKLCGECFGKANNNGIGHWHIFVDTPMMQKMLMASGTSKGVSLKGISPG